MPEKRRGSVSARFSVWLSRRRAAANWSEARVHDLEPAGILLPERGAAAQQEEAGALLLAGLRQQQRAAVEAEGGEGVAAAGPCSGGLPVQAPGDHEVQHQEQLVLEGDHDALAEALQADHRPPLGCLQRRVHRAQQGDAAQLDGLETPARDSRLEGLQIDRDVGKLRHAGCGRVSRLRAGRGRAAAARGAPPARTRPRGDSRRG